MSPLASHFDNMPSSETLRPTALGFQATERMKTSYGTSNASRFGTNQPSPSIRMMGDPEEEMNERPKPTGIPAHQSALMNGLRSARAKVSLSQIDCIEVIEAALDPTISDPDLCKMFISTANQTLPNTVELLFAQLTKSGGLVKPIVEWIKKKIKTSTGLNLQDDIHNFMQLFQANTRCSDMLATIAAIHYTAVDRKASSTKEPQNPKTPSKCKIINKLL